MNNIHELNEEFKLPITYLSQNNKYELADNLQTDLELKETYDNSNNCIYDHLFDSTNPFSKQVIQSWSDYYTTDTTFLKESQKLYKEIEVSNRHDPSDIENIIEMWNELKTDVNFKERYCYVEWDMLEKLNSSSYFLSGLTLATLTSPILTIVIPVLLMIVPFFMLKIQQNSIAFAEYFVVLKQLFSKLPVGRIFQFNSMTVEQRVTSLVSVFFYFFQIYQNFMHCYRYHKNLQKMHVYIEQLRSYNDITIQSMNECLSFTDSLSSYNEFNIVVKNHKYILEEMNAELYKVTPYKFGFSKIVNVGQALKQFYAIHCNTTYHETLIYSFGFNGYIDNILQLRELIDNKVVNKCSFSKKDTEFKNAYFAPLKDSEPVKNTYNLKKNMIITGPNAAGKTTMLKTTLFNIILSQQIGFGFYKSAKVNPYDYIHCYINIPDTSGRDSLFQAEARRCKDIIDCIETYSNKRHFCVFDELYSGTNPYEAIASAYSYLHFMNANKNVNYVLTTHYIDLCLKIERRDNKCSVNYHMEIDNSGDEFKYTYRISRGISEIKGGIKVLKELNYPKSIIELTESIINNSLSI